jgi:hypothetical protein
MPEYFDCHADVVVERPDPVKPSPLPWTVDGPYADESSDILGPSEAWIAEAFSYADAEFIVTACNAFPALVEALKALVSTHDAIVGGLGKSDPPAITQARAALTLAGVETK